MNFVQTFSVRSNNPEALVELAARWDENQAAADVMGYLGSHVLADREHPGEYMMVAEFGVVDPNVTALEEAQRNNDRPETQEWARRLHEVIDGEPVWRHYDVLYRTG
jgi:hypothetical protein